MEGFLTIFKDLEVHINSISGSELTALCEKKFRSEGVRK